MGMMKRFYESRVVRILYYSNGHDCQAMFKRNPDGTYKEGFEYRDGHGNVLERTKLEGQYTIDEVLDKCNRLCENYETYMITIE